jgi:restriction endonuclease S subunit
MTEQSSLGDISESATNNQNNKTSGFKETSLGRIPADWEVKNLGEDFEINYGNGKKEDEFVEDGSYPVYGANGIIGRSDDYIYENPVVTVTCRGATCGNVNLTQPKSWVTNNSLVLENGNDNNPIFLAEALRQHSVDRAITGSAQPQITSTLLSKMDYLKVPLPEQRRIASVLYNVDQAISKTEEIIEQTQRVKKGLMQGLFTEGYYSHEEFEERRLLAHKSRAPAKWEIKSVKEISAKVTDGAHLTPDRSESGNLLLSARNVKNGFLDLSEVDYVPDDEYERLTDKCNPETDDILISCSGTVGRICRVPEDDNFALVRSAALVKLKEGYHPFYIEQVLQSSMVQKQIEGYQTQSAQPNLFQGQISSIEIPVPEPEEQEKIADLLKKYDEKVKQEENYLEKLKSLKKGLMQDLLTGSVRTGEDVRVLDEVVEVEG